MTKTPFSFSLTVLACGLLPGCARQEPADLLPSEAVQFRFVLLAQSPEGETVAFARAILDSGQPCPTIDGDTPHAMTPRQNPHQFPVAVCEAQIGFDEDLHIPVQGGELSLPRVRRDPQRIILMGDTGCSASDCAEGQPAQPFASLAAKAASDAPVDLLLHAGDYNYRGTPSKVSLKDPETGQITTTWAYDAGDGTEQNENCGQAPDSGFVSQNSPQSTQPDAWEFWRDDFFAAAGEMLWSAPWVFARGNHELCSRAGPGWFYFLDASSDLPAGGAEQRFCPSPDPQVNPFRNVVLVPPYLVDLGSLRLAVVDSANACDAFATPQMTAFTTNYVWQFGQVAAMTPAQGASWLITHRPIWGVEEYEEGTSTGCSAENRYACINRTMQDAIQQVPGGSLPSGIKLLLSGHMHRFQSLTFASQRPPQLIVGDSGIELDSRPPVGAFQTQVQGVQAQGRATGASITSSSGPVQAFAFMEILYSPQGWEGALTNLDNSVTIARCGSQQQAQGSVCEFESGIEVR